MKKNDIDNYFKSRSHSFDEMPSDDLWKKIENNLAQEPKFKSNFKKHFLAMALTIIALITVASLSLNNNNSEKSNKTISINDSIKKEKALIDPDSNIQLKPPLSVLKKTPPVNKAPSIINSKNNRLISGKINVSQSIIKKDIETQNTLTESLRNDSLINANELVIDSTAQTTKINNLKEEEPRTARIINDSLINRNELTIKPVESIMQTTRKNIIQIAETSNIQEKIYSMNEVHIKPEYIGGINKLYVLIDKRFKVPKGCPGGRITLTFVIDKDGSLTDIQTLKDVGFGTGAEAIRVLKESPKWKPGKQDGKIVRVQYTLPITIQATANIEVDNLVYNMAGINVQPEFIGGKEKLYEFIYRKYRIRRDYPEGKIYLSFIIEKNGSLSSFKVIKDIGLGSGEEAIRVLKNSPLWEPGEQDGKKVRVLYNLPITISRDDKE